MRKYGSFCKPSVNDVKVGNFKSHCHLEMRKLSDGGSYISLLPISQYSIIHLISWKPQFLYFYPTMILMNMNALSMAEGLVSSYLILLHLWVNHPHSMITFPLYMWMKCPELEFLMRSERQQWYFEYIRSRLKLLLFLHLFFLIAPGVCCIEIQCTFLLDQQKV